MELNVSIERLVACCLELSDVARLAMTCTRWKEQSDDERVWEAVYRGHFGSQASFGESSDSVQWCKRLKIAISVARPGALVASHFGIQAKARSGHSATYIESIRSVLLLAGASNNFYFTDDAELLDIETGATRTFTTTLSPRWLHTATLMDGNLIVVGGQDNYGVHQEMLRAQNLSGQCETSTVLCFDNLKDIQRFGDTGIQGWAGHTANVWSSRILLFGGKALDESVRNSLFAFRPSSLVIDEVATIGQAPSPRWCHSSAVTSELIIFGGWDPALIENPFFNDLFLLDLETLVWSTLALYGLPPCPRCQTTLSILPNDFLLLFGGASHSDSDEPTYGDRVTDLDDFCILDLRTKTWLITQSSYNPLRGGVNAIVDVGHRLLICGGMHSDPGDRMPTFMREIASMSKQF